MQDFQFELGNDKCFLKHAYNLLMHEEAIDPNAASICESNVPNKVKDFGWLLFCNRLNTKLNLHHKHIVDSSSCLRCQLRTYSSTTPLCHTDLARPKVSIYINRISILFGRCNRLYTSNSNSVACRTHRRPMEDLGCKESRTFRDGRIDLLNQLAR